MTCFYELTQHFLGEESGLWGGGVLGVWWLYMKRFIQNNLP
jgi:hypothetical protein